MYDLCEALGANYTTIKDAFLLRGTATPDYMSCGPELRGFGGVCLPKDVRALARLFDEMKIPFSLFHTVEQSNARTSATVFAGMRA